MATYHTLISTTGIAYEYMYVHVCVIHCCRADVNGNGSLDEKEFYQFVEQVKLKYPQLMTHLSMACDYSIEK